MLEYIRQDSLVVVASVLFGWLVYGDC